MTDALKSWADWYVSCAGGNIPNEAQAAYDAIAEIARLQAEVERLRIIADGKWKCIERTEDVRIHNAALEEAAIELDGWGDIYGYNAAAAIRALKRKEPTDDQSS